MEEPLPVGSVDRDAAAVDPAKWAAELAGGVGALLAFNNAVHAHEDLLGEPLLSQLL